MSTNTNSGQVSVLDQAPKAPKTPKTPKANDGKTSVGLLVTFFCIIGAILVVGSILAVVLIFRIVDTGVKKTTGDTTITISDDDKKNDDDGKNEKKDDDKKKEEKKKDDDDDNDDSSKVDSNASLTSLSAGFDGKSFKLAKNFSETVKNAAEVFDIYYLDDDYDYQKISNIDDYLSKNNTGDDAFFTLYAAKKGTDADDVDKNNIEISGTTSYDSDSRQNTPLSKLLLWTVQSNTNSDVTTTIGALKFTTKETTPSDVQKVLGERKDIGSSDSKWDVFTRTGYSYSVYYSGERQTVHRVEISVTVY